MTSCPPVGSTLQQYPYMNRPAVLATGLFSSGFGPMPNSLVMESVSLESLPSLDLKMSAPSTKPIKLLLLHGGPGMDYSYFFPFLAPLQREANLVFYTQGSSGALTIAGLLNELHAVLQRFKHDQVVIFAHSFGAALIFEYIKMYGDNSIAALILSSWAYDMHWVERYLSKFPSETSKETYAINDDYRNQTLKMIARYFTPPFIEIGREVLQKVKYNATLSNAIWGSFLSGFDGREVVRSFSKPILSISGTDDLITDHDYLCDGVKLNDSIEAINIGNVGHFPFIETPDIFNQAILRFLSSFSKGRNV